MSEQNQTADFIKLDRFLKWQGITQTGGEAKIRIQEGEVIVNGKIETRRGKKLRTGDRVTIANKTYTVNLP
ncbi:RNA-binding S4 domain protein [Hyella patelloides LEGE 07179]|uniref:RNA-binding S4 domain protein n=1 Tax=Hyella patelloides LEGE 07179 TaxID=945734 RepID=A0A563VK30_9CYAN|nr:RNA-binding S4 domain-containing protein [Hyella patelloides]VEP11703.1 RNA-binding S4 domain protein [Hyella patelloides LEGE 07179]